MLTFMIPLMSKKTANNWDTVSTLFNRTLWSCYNQTDPDYRILVACHEIPILTHKYDDRVEFIQVSEEDAPIPTNQDEKMIDKGYKTHTLAMRLRELGGGFAMLVDADDLVSCHLAEFVNSHKYSNGYYVKTGYVYFVGDTFMKVCPKFPASTAYIINYSIDDLPNEYPEIMKDNCDDNPWIIRKRHGGIVAACKQLGRPLEVLPFKAVVYVLGSGNNHSLHRKKNKYQTKLRALRQFFERKRKIRGKLKEEFSIDWL